MLHPILQAIAIGWGLSALTGIWIELSAIRKKMERK